MRIEFILAVLVYWVMTACIRTTTAKLSHRETVELATIAVEDKWQVPIISTAQLREGLAAKNLLLIDNRSLEEFRVSRIPGAVHISQFDATAKTVRPVIIYCTIGERSGAAVKRLNATGYHARNYPGSLLRWIHEGGPLVDSEGRPTKAVHPYSDEWNLLPEDYSARYQ